VQTLFTGPNATAIEVDPVAAKFIGPKDQHRCRQIAAGQSRRSLPQTLFTASGVLYGVTVGYDPNFFPLMGRVYFSLQDAANTLRYIDINGGPTTIVATDLTIRSTAPISMMAPSVLFGQISSAYRTAAKSGRRSPTGHFPIDYDRWP